MHEFHTRATTYRTLDTIAPECIVVVVEGVFVILTISVRILRFAVNHNAEVLFNPIIVDLVMALPTLTDCLIIVCHRIGGTQFTFTVVQGLS